VEHVVALAVPANPLEQVHPDTEKVLGVKSSSFLFASRYPVVEVGVTQFGVEHTTPPLPVKAAVHAVPPEEAVHRLSLEQVAILEVDPLMSMVVLELIMVTDPLPPDLM